LILDSPNFIKMKRYFHSNFNRSTKIQWSERLLLHSTSEIEEAMGRRHGQRQESSGSHYSALNFDLILPMRSRRHKELILLTCGVEVFFQRCSDFKGMRRSFLVLPSSILSSQLLQMAAENSSLVVT
jgi:hypothetical protein